MQMQDGTVMRHKYMAISDNADHKTVFAWMRINLICCGIEHIVRNAGFLKREL
jgi:hypothetical protein